MKVMTKTAITTVTSRDCKELRMSACGCFSFTSIGASLGAFVAPGSAGRLRGRRGKIFQHLVGGVLLRIFLGSAVCSTHEFRLAFAVERLQPYFDRERLAVFRTTLFHQYVGRLRSSG